MEEFYVKVDSKGRLYLPAEVREQIGDTVILRRVDEGFLIVPGKPQTFIEEFCRIITSPPPRTGEPENWPPSKMKSIWSS